ncbi:MAG: CHAD domain-containing protein [Pirellulales bacterium]
MSLGGSDNAISMTPARLFGQVQRFALLAAKRSHEDREYVHKLRVATRRAAVVVEALAADFEGDDARRILRGLRRLRRKAGVARDLDVRLAELVVDHSLLERETQIALVHRLALARGEAQQALAIHVKERRKAGEFKEWHSLAKRMHRRAKRVGRFELAVSSRLTQSIQQLEEQSSPWPVLPKQLHRLRREVRRARYLVEWIAGGMSQESRQTLMGELRACQEDLGAWHDKWIGGHVWRQWGEEAGPEMHEAMERWNHETVDAEQQSRMQCESTWAGERFQRLTALLRQPLSSEPRDLG